MTELTFHRMSYVSKEAKAHDLSNKCLFEHTLPNNKGEVLIETLGPLQHLEDVGACVPQRHSIVEFPHRRDKIECPPYCKSWTN